jgi:hypothetical protein
MKAEPFLGHFTSLVTRENVNTYHLHAANDAADTVEGPMFPDPDNLDVMINNPPSIAHLNFGPIDTPTTHPVIVALPLCLPLPLGVQFTPGGNLGDPHMHMDATYAFFYVWRTALLYVSTNNDSNSVTLGGPLMEPTQISEVPFEALHIEPRLPNLVSMLTPQTPTTRVSAPLSRQPVQQPGPASAAPLTRRHQPPLPQISQLHQQCSGQTKSQHYLQGWPAPTPKRLYFHFMCQKCFCKWGNKCNFAHVTIFRSRKIQQGRTRRKWTPITSTV